MRYHVIWATYGSWLPGDPRGFRTKHHRLHVDGDYRNPPPKGAYDGLYRHARKSLKKDPVVIPDELRVAVGKACLERFALEDVAVAAISVGGQHIHVAFEWASDNVKPVIGRVKRVSSHRIRQWLPGRVWAANCKVIRVRDEQHWWKLVDYIKGHEREGSWVWVSRR